MSDTETSADEALLSVRDLVVEFPVGKKKVSAVSGVSFEVHRGETLGLVGESGCGKTTTGRAIMQLTPPDSGSVVLDGVDLTTLRHADLRQARTRMQMVFQDPISSLNPRRNAREIVMEPLIIWRSGTQEEIDERVDQLLTDVGLDPERAAESRPHQLSGGQCQRLSIARALMLDPELLICDEPVSALDVSVQAQVINLLQELKAKYGLTMVFIAHDLAVVKNISDRIAVMYLGKICEVGPADDLCDNPAHHYTRGLLSSVPIPDPTVGRQHIPIEGELPSPLNPPPGCRFNPRCPAATDICRTTEPELREISDGHVVACHHPLIEPPDHLRDEDSQVLSL